MARRKEPRRPSPAPPGSRRAGWVLRGLALVALVLVATTDDRLFGINPDGRVMLRTAASLAELGELGIARGTAVTVDRPGGDSVTRYGLLPSIALAPVVAVARPFEAAFGPGSSQVLFALYQVLLLLGVSAATGGLARSLGGDERAAFRAAVAVALSSPLWAYASSDFSEPLQAALVAAAIALALAAGSRPEPREAFRLALLSGAALGGALLARSLLVLAVPPVAVILWAGGGATRRSRLAGAAAGFGPLALLWGAFDVARFGRLLGGYGGERFTHPVWDGAWRLLVWPNTGLLLYFPLSLLGLYGLFRMARRSVAALAAAAFCGTLFVAVAAWWGWDGGLGWGPRLLLPCLPVVAAAAACEAGRHRPALFRGLFAAGMLVNGLGVLQPDAAVKAYLSILPPRRLEEREASEYPPFTYRLGAGGGALLDPLYWSATEASLAPIRLGSWLLVQRIRGGEIAQRLKSPPWDTSRPGLGPVRDFADALPAAKQDLLFGPFRWPWLGRTLLGGGREGDANSAYLDALRDQANRAQDMGKSARAVAFSERLRAARPGPETAVVLAESYRLAGKREELVKLSDSLWESGQSPDVRLFLVLGLFARDLGSDAEAASLVARAAGSTANDEVKKWAAVPPRQWPKTLREMTGESRRPRDGTPGT